MFVAKKRGDYMLYLNQIPNFQQQQFFSYRQTQTAFSTVPAKGKINTNIIVSKGTYVILLIHLGINPDQDQPSFVA